MSDLGYSGVIHLVGLGGAGTNIVESFLKNEKTMELLDSGVTRLSLMALDIADPDIKSLEETHKKVLDAMKRNGIPRERLSLIARSIKFPSAEAMFDFVHHKFSEHLVNEGIRVKEYNPWLPSTVAIPPLAGGAGRRRSLAKAIYNLNYYQLGIIKSLINMYKDHALSSINAPIILLLFGLGGGTGSGIVFDFARHLRKSVGSGVPILALCVLPCAGDDPPAKGYSAYNAVTEFTALLNRETNEKLVEKLGEEYRNPFNSVLFLPLMPAYSKTGNIMLARDEIDQMITEMIYVLMDFDMADLMSGIGTEVGLLDNSIHTLSMVKVNYPVDAYVDAFKSKLEEMQQLSQIRREKLNFLEMINKVLGVKYAEVSNLYKQYLIRTNSYVEDEFEEKLRSLIYGSPRFDEDYNLYIRGVQDQIKSWIDDSIQFISTIKVVAQEGTIEDSIMKLTLQTDGSSNQDSLEGLMKNLMRNHSEFSELKTAVFERLQQLVPSSQLLSVRQKKLVEDFMTLADVTEKVLDILRFYNETRHLTDAMIRRYEILPEDEFPPINFQDFKAELTTLYHLLQLMVKHASDEVKMIDEHLTYLQAIVGKFRGRKEAMENELYRLEERQKRKEFDKQKYEKESGGFFRFGKKRYAKEKLNEVERELRVINEEMLTGNEEIGKTDVVTELYNDLLKNLEVTSDYRKKLNIVLELNKEYQRLFSEIIKPKRFYERTTELTQDEQVKIIYKILAEQEEALSREGILREILDVEHFKDYMRSVVRVYRTPNIMGLKSSFRSDYLWVTVQTPPGLWDSDLTQELYTALAGYVTGDVSKTITVREVNARDPWVIRVVVVGGRSRVEDLATYDEMERLNRKASDFEKGLSKSFLIEHKASLKEILKKGY
ncbi:Tubulin-like protein CetZ [subsurface metagenome]